jgi:hypothetical protein
MGEEVTETMPPVIDVARRALPEAPASQCQTCGLPVVWAVTLAGPNGRGGKLMPLDPIEDLDGNVAATSPTRGRLLARVLQRDEAVDRPLEYAAIPHFATCLGGVRGADQVGLPADVIRLEEERARRRGRRR